MMVYNHLNEDMFDEVDRISEDSEYTDGLILVNDFNLYLRHNADFVDFYIEGN